MVGVSYRSEIHSYLVTRNVLMVYVELSAVANSIEESGYIPDRWNEDVCIHKYQLIILM